MGTIEKNGDFCLEIFLSMSWNKEFLKKTGIFALFVLGFWMISLLYLSPALDGMMIRQGDMTQSRLMRADLQQYQEKTGEVMDWAPNIFGGMPSDLILGKPGGNLIYRSGIFRIFHLVSSPFDFLFLAMLSMFVLLKSAKINNWLAAAGAIGYAFMTFTIVSYEAGHITKVQAMAMMPGVLAGLMLLIRRKYLLGTLVTGIFFTSCLGFFHYQIAYYVGICLALFGVVIVITGFINKDWKHIGLTIGGLFLASLLTVASNSQKIIDTKNYSAETMRGGSKLSSDLPEAGAENNTNVKGLSLDYAYSWSYMPKELFTLIVPRFMGGSSAENVGYNEEFGTEILPLYHGNLASTAGPIYIGAVFMVLFIAAFVICIRFLKDNKEGENRKVVLIITAAVALTFIASVILGLGKYVSINTWLFDTLPYYNKFRTPMMALCIAQMLIPFYSMYGLHLMFEQSDSKASSKLFKPVLISVGSILMLTFLTVKMQEYGGLRDAQIAGEGAGSYQTINLFKEFRESAATDDFLRTFGFAAAALLLIYLTIKKTIPKNVAWIGLVALCSIDMIGVSKRYLSEDNWEYKEDQTVAPPTPFDLQLQAVNKDKARVLDLRTDPFNSNTSVPYHRNIGGYHPAKLSAYQDLISYGVTPNGGQFNTEVINNNNALDMMNCAYVLTSNPQTKSTEVIPRSTALGNSWFVATVRVADSAKDEMEMVNTLNLSKEAIFSKENKQPSATSYLVDSATASIRQTYFSPDTIRYKSSNANLGLAVFSEVFYSIEGSGWIATIDNKEASILKANYLLRAMEIPAGEHTIEFVFNPAKKQFVPLEKAASGILLFGLIGVLILEALGKKIKGVNA